MGVFLNRNAAETRTNPGRFRFSKKPCSIRAHQKSTSRIAGDTDPRGTKAARVFYCLAEK
jgi:hypothetical protein